MKQNKSKAVKKVTIKEIKPKKAPIKKYTEDGFRIMAREHKTFLELLTIHMGLVYIALRILE